MRVQRRVTQVTLPASTDVVPLVCLVLGSPLSFLSLLQIVGTLLKSPHQLRTVYLRVLVSLEVNPLRLVPENSLSLLHQL